MYEQVGIFVFVLDVLCFMHTDSSGGHPMLH